MKPSRRKPEAELRSVPVMVRMPPSLRERLGKMARERGVTMSDVVRQLILGSVADSMNAEILARHGRAG